MDKEKYWIISLWVIVVFVLAWAIYQTLTLLADYAPAIIAGVVTIYVALLNHSLTAQRELKSQHQKEKQENYKKLLSVAAEFVRDPKDKDIWDTIHLYSWVVGSEKVIRETQSFTENPSDANLRNLLITMRKDVGLDEPSEDLMPLVFNEEEPRGYLKRHDRSEENLLPRNAKGRPKRSFWPL